ncbi:cathepsin L1-like [Spodoptera litura]|uniref:Cathepsin L1-like n=1 Tax=Spodoptera litura TaxID=69820 RepID=A0A9J7E3M0_SPOLT|nr:cathepsin L1-like [Spodoptera litura]
MSPIFIWFFGFAVSAVWSASPYNIEYAESHFEEFIKKFGKKYQNHVEKQFRFEIFVKNLKKVNKLNEECDHAVHGITQFMDLDVEEFSSIYSCLPSVDVFDFDSGCDYDDCDPTCNHNDAPESFDWRDHGVVSSVKDQGNCGSCYAFSAVGNIEGQHAIKHKELLDLSPQQIVDCDLDSSGCEGGLMSFAFRTIKNTGGIESEADYPYIHDEMDDCYFDVNKVKVKLSDCRAFNLTSQEKLKQLVYKTGPISIAIQADGLQTYTNGIFPDEHCNVGSINHGVLLVGYGVEKDVPFWIIKNSWGEKFGEKGYFRVARGENLNSCKMLNNAMSTSIVV